MKNKVVWTILFVVAVVVLWSQFTSLNEENQELRAKLDNYEEALAEANENIEEANDVIDEARSHAWESYEEMGAALDDMYMVDTVDEPTSRNPFLDFNFR